MSVDYPVVIVGGGPAGSALGNYLGRAGIKCLILEKERFPRPHVGESMVPSSNRVFNELELFPLLEDAGFIHKYGAVWTTWQDKNYLHDWQGLQDHGCVDIRFDERNISGVESPYTYHVDRAKFDHILLQEAERNGADVKQECQVLKVEFHDEYVEVFFSDSEGEQNSICSSLIVDASGRNTVLGNQLKLKVKDPVFDQCAFHTWFSDFDRGDDRLSDFIHVHFVPVTNTWIWQIPISEEYTSIGLVTQKKNFPKSDKERESFFWQLASQRPELSERLKAAKQARPFKVEADYSYAMKAFSGDRFMLCGDAARFVDPIFSSGVSIALNSARFAAMDIQKAVESNDFSGSAFESYNTTMTRGCKNWYEFICMYYRLNVLFTYFIQHPDHRLSVLKYLQGDVYDSGDEKLIEDMRIMIREVESNKDHIWHDLLGSLSSDELKNAVS